MDKTPRTKKSTATSERAAAKTLTDLDARQTAGGVRGGRVKSADKASKKIGDFIRG